MSTPTASPGPLPAKTRDAILAAIVAVVAMLAAITAWLSPTAPTPVPTPTPTPSATPTPTLSPSRSPSSTPSPTATTSSVTGCYAKPSACGFPDGTNTGVEAGVTLKPSGSLTVTTPGTVVANLDITGTLTIAANNVTVRDVKVDATGGNCAICTSWTHAGIVIQHVEIDGHHRSPSVPGIVGGGYTATALNIHGTGDAIDLNGNETVKDSWIHDLQVSAGDHSDGVQSTGTDADVISHNTIDATLPGGGVANSALIIGADLANMGTVTVSNNLLAGGNYTVYSGADAGYTSGTITFTGNRFVANAQYGPCSFQPSAGRSIGFTGNVWDATGAALTC